MCTAARLLPLRAPRCCTSVDFPQPAGPHRSTGWPAATEIDVKRAVRQIEGVNTNVSAPLLRFSGPIAGPRRSWSHMATVSSSLGSLTASPAMQLRIAALSSLDKLSQDFTHREALMVASCSETAFATKI